MKRLAAAVLALGFALPGAALAQAAPGPDAPYERAAELPEDLQMMLVAKRFRLLGPRVLRADGTPLTNREVEALLSAYRAEKLFPPEPVLAVEPSTPIGRRDVRRGMDGLDLEEAFESLVQKAKGDSAQAAPAKKKERRGFRFMGLDIGGTSPDIESEDYELSQRKGIDRALDWDMRFKVGLDYLGGRLKYRHLEEHQSLGLTYKQFTDVPHLLGVGEARDSAYSAFGSDPPDKKEGFEVDLGGTVNEYWGLGASYSQADTDRPGAQADEFRRITALRAGWSPLGENPGKPWNYTWIGSVNHQQLELRHVGGPEERSGLGWTFGASFQHALDAVPLPLFHGFDFGKRNVKLDRLKVYLGLSDSEVSSFATSASIAATAWITKNLELSLGYGLDWRPDPREEEQEFDAGFRFGARLQL